MRACQTSWRLSIERPIRRRIYQLIRRRTSVWKGMQFYTRLAVLCLFAGVSASALGQATNAPTSPTLTPDAEKRARQLLDSLGKGAPPAAPTLQEREAARKRAEAEAKQRLEEQKKRSPLLPLRLSSRPWKAIVNNASVN